MRILLLVLLILLPTLAQAETAPGMAAADRLARARTWLRMHPDDGDAWRFAGQQMMEVERFEEAADALARAAALGKGDAVTQAAALIRLGRMGEARAVADEQTARQPDRERASLRLVAKALAGAGETGRAREVLDAALARTPADALLLAERGELELAAGRPLRAVAALERALALRPRDNGIRRTLMRAWIEAGEPARAMEAFDGTTPDDGLTAMALAALRALGDHAKAVAMAEGHLGNRPRSAPVMRAMAPSLAALGARDKAAQTLARAFRLAPPDAASLDLARTLLPETERAALLAELRRRFPWMPELFEAGGSPPRDLAWPWLAEAARLPRAEARQRLADALGAIPEHAASQRAQLLLAMAGVEDDAGTALAHLDRAEAADAPRGDVLARRYAVLSGAGRWDEAATAAWDWARTRPDDADALAALFRPEIADRLGWARAFAHLHDHVRRDPEDPARHRRALDRHRGPGGAPPLALLHALALGETAPPAPAPEEASHHPVTGRLLKVSDGERWIEAEWSPDALDLVGLTDSAGNRVTLLRRMGKLVAIEATGSAPFQATLGPDGRPSRLTSPLDDARAADAYNRAVAATTLWPKASPAEARGIRLVP